ncbi:MAG: diguanylate cyclase [Thermoleophilia bacterium]|nr:diguanylate cyclase [Thermoleophilia bacterium]
MTKLHVKSGAIALIACVVLYQVFAGLVLAPGSSARVILSDAGFVVIQLIVLGLSVTAYFCNKGKPDRWIWAWVSIWMLFNIFADSAWAYYELVLKTDPPSPGLPDVGYLGSYVVAFAGILLAAYKAFGFMRALETTLDATMFTLGTAALAWPLLLSRLLEGSSGAEYWVTLAYPIGDLLFILAFASFFFGSVSSTGRRPQPYFFVLCIAFFCQIVADFAYFADAVSYETYEPGSWMDGVWSLCFAVAGIAALMGMRASREPSRADVEDATDTAPRGNLTSGNWRIAIPYIALPVITATLISHLHANGWSWNHDTLPIVYLGLALVVLLVCRQYVVLSQNRHLNLQLARTSDELQDKVGNLADLSRQLETLNHRAHHLNSLNTLSEVAEAGLDIACYFEQARGGWVSLKNPGGEESVIAVKGAIVEGRSRGTHLDPLEAAWGGFRAASLEVRGEGLGTIYLLEPRDRDEGPDLLPVIAAHVATAIDNAQRYQDALNLAERDPLTSLYNHRGVHKRLAGEALRARQSGSELSLIMMDLDDFKLLNDTYGHPVGDSVLRHVGEAVRGVLRHADLAGRVGGDELLVVLPNTGVEGALQLSERLRDTIRTHPYVTPGGHVIPVRASLGVATYPPDAQSLGQLLEIADANLYASKQRGGNTVTGKPAEVETDRPEDGGVLGIAGRLLSVVGARDHYTRRHSEQVALYALSLGEAVGLADEDLSTLHVAAMLHDVGKIGVPSSLLHKPSPLTPAEEDLVRRHVDMGAAVITDMPRLARVAEIVRAHHEHHDGGGYPTESRGDEIPLLARVLAVADAYSAMTLNRPYRKPLTPEQARAELLGAAGTQLDPDLVRLFVEILDRRERRAAGTHAEAG